MSKKDTGQQNDCSVDCGLHRHLWCQQHVVHRLETEPLQLLDHAHATVYRPEFVTDCTPALNFKKYLKTYLFSILFSLSF